MTPAVQGSMVQAQLLWNASGGALSTPQSLFRSLERVGGWWAKPWFQPRNSRKLLWLTSTCVLLFLPTFLLLQVPTPNSS